MERKYNEDLLQKLQERQYVKKEKGIEIIYKGIPDTDEAGVMDPRLYKSMRKQLMIMRFLPKSMFSNKDPMLMVKRFRKMFNGVKSIPIVTAKIDINRLNIDCGDAFVPIRIYKPEGNKRNLPICLYFHGGGFFAGSPDVVEELCKVLVEREGIVAISVDYRLAPENKYPASHDDCFNALKWAYNNADSFGGDKNKICVSGDSAGGNLATFCAMKDRDLKLGMVKLEALIYPSVNMGAVEDEDYHWSVEQYEISKKHKYALNMMINVFGDFGDSFKAILGVDDIRTPYFTPYIGDLKGMPPTIILFGEHDFLKVECVSYAVKLNKAGVKTRTIIYRGLGHGFADVIGGYPQAEDCMIEIGKFIRENL
jgi:acetyl esterase